MNQPGNTYGDWRRIDVDGNDLKIADFSKVWPYNEIKTVTVDGQQMARIPKIYVNNTKLTSGPYAGKYAYLIAPDKIDDTWHVHPAFMNNGKEMSGVQIGKYLASKDSSGKAASIKGASFWTNITRDDAHKAGLTRNVSGGTGEKTGWHMYNIYEHHLIARLMLIEYGSSNLQTLLTGSDSGMDAKYHGIEMVWGGASYGEWFDGIDTLGTNSAVRIFKNDGSQTYVDTGITPCGAGWLKDVLHNKGTNYDLGDVFLAASVDGTQANGSFGDYQYFYGGYVFNSYWSARADRGPFCLHASSTSCTSSALGFRLARYA